MHVVKNEDMTYDIILGQDILVINFKINQIT